MASLINLAKEVMGVWRPVLQVLSVLVWNATPWGDAIRAANAIPLLFSSYVETSIRLYIVIN